MPRIRPIDPDEASPSLHEMFDRFRRQRGNVPNMFRTMALRPEIALTAEAHLNAIFGSGTVERRLKEMLSVRVSQINQCHY
jgi:alkylhydroperoxidase family enzyme